MKTPSLESFSSGLPEPDTSIDTFTDALWLEEGLSKNTLSAYRRDLTLYAVWLAGRGQSLLATLQADLDAYFSAQHGTSKATRPTVG